MGRPPQPTLRQVHVAGEKLFVDYSGHTMEVVDGLTGEVRSTQIFVAVLGASNYTYAEASLSQRNLPVDQLQDPEQGFAPASASRLARIPTRSSRSVTSALQSLVAQDLIGELRRRPAEAPIDSFQV